MQTLSLLTELETRMRLHVAIKTTTVNLILCMRLSEIFSLTS